MLVSICLLVHTDVSHRSKRTNRPKYAGRVPGNEAGPRDEGKNNCLFFCEFRPYMNN